MKRLRPWSSGPQSGRPERETGTKRPGKARSVVSCFALGIALAAGIVSGDPAATAAPMGGGSTFLGRTPGSQPLTISLVLPLRNQDQLAALLGHLYKPGDPLYGKYITPKQFTEQFGPTQGQVDLIKGFAQSSRLQVVDVSANNTTIKLSGTISQVEATFRTQLNFYRSQTGRVFYAPNTPIVLPPELQDQVTAVIGLTSKTEPKTFSRRAQSGAAGAPLLQYFTGNIGLSPTDVKNLYNLTTIKQTGIGQTVGLFEMDGWTPSDITTFESFYNIPSLTPTLVPVDGGTGAASGSAAGETTLDIDMVLALAPGVSSILVYQAPPLSASATYSVYEQQAVDIFNKIANDDAAGIVSVSYGVSELDINTGTVTYKGSTVGFTNAEDQLFQQMAAQGQTVCVASGDSGAYTDEYYSVPNTADPASHPWVLAVGGTDLQDTPTPTTLTAKYVSEQAWWFPYDYGRGPRGTGGGGGVSTLWSIPAWQTPLVNTTYNPQGSKTYRNVPDVSLYGDYDSGGYDIYYTDPTAASSPGWGAFNGTSAAAPLWAAFLATVNQARAAQNLHGIGFANPAIYATAANAAKYAADFHDISDSTWNGYYYTTKGYDNATGLGTLIGDKLFADLVPSANNTTIGPKSLTFSPTSVIAGQTTTGTVTLTAAAQPGGASVKITTGTTYVTTVVIPAGAATGTFNVTVPSTASTATATYTATFDLKAINGSFTVNGIPKIASFTPAVGPAGTAVTITGTNLGTASSVKFNGLTGTVTSKTATQVVANTPAGTTTGHITITTPGGTAISAGSFTGAPTIGSFTPTSGALGAVVTITGTNLASATSVKFNGTAATITSDSATQIVTKAPAGTTTGPLTVTTAGGTATSATSFTFLPAPTITSFTPTSGPVGTTVTITGTNLSTATALKFNATAAVITSKTATQIVTKVPAGATTGQITVTSPGGTAISSAGFTVN